MKIKKILLSSLLALSAVGLASCVTNSAVPSSSEETSSKETSEASSSKKEESSSTNESSDASSSKKEEPSSSKESTESSSEKEEPSSSKESEASSELESNSQNTSVPEVESKVEIQGTVNILRASGYLESAYLEWEKISGVKDYHVYYKKKGVADSNYVQIDANLVREYGSYYRADVLGLKSDDYDLKVVPVVSNTEQNANATVVSTNVLAHERSGYGFVNGTSSGAYNDDGTLKSNAVVFYYTNSNKETISYKVGTTTYTGMVAILTALKKSTTPVCVRIIGDVHEATDYEKGDFLIDTVKFGLTVEGVGEDATCNGFGIRIKNASNVEIRNLGFMNCHSDEGDSIGLQQGNDHIWVHNNDIFYGDAGGDADQAKGDGALDTKKSSYVTHSYNHFYDSGKSNLQGMKDETTSNCITYHHNWYDHSDSRHPRVRTCTVHVYNNYFDGIAKYGVGATLGCSIFVENNYFRNSDTLRPMMSSRQGTDALGEGTFSGDAGGMIKSYGNTYDTPNLKLITQKNATKTNDIDCYEASSRNEQVPSSYVTLVGGTAYSNFDTQSSFYSYEVDTPEVAVIKVKKYAGRINGGDFHWTFNNATDDTFYGVDKALKTALGAYKTSLVSILGDTSYSGGGSSTDPVTPVVTVTAEDVIKAISLLPEVADVDASYRSSILAAKEKYESLSDTEKAKVDSASKTKLDNLIVAINNLHVSAELTFDESNKVDEAGFFTVNGTINTKGGSATINGQTQTDSLKMDSSGSVTFTLTSKSTVTITIKGGSSIYIKSGSTVVTTLTLKSTVDDYSLELEAGTYTICKNSGESYLFKVTVE